MRLQPSLPWADPERVVCAALSPVWTGFATIVGQLAMGVVRLGFLVNFLSHPVLSGFTSAAALVIACSQLKHLLGVSLPHQR